MHKEQQGPIRVIFNPVKENQHHEGKIPIFKKYLIWCLFVTVKHKH